MRAGLQEEVRTATCDRAVVVAFCAAGLARGRHEGRARALYLGDPEDALFDIRPPYPAVAIEASSQRLTFLRTRWRFQTFIRAYGNPEWGAVVLSLDQVTYLLGRMKRDGRFRLADAPQWFRNRWGLLERRSGESGFGLTKWASAGHLS